MLKNRPSLVYEYVLEDQYAKKLISVSEPNNKYQQLIDNIGIEVRNRSEVLITNRNTYINECHQGTFNTGPNDLLNTEWNSNQITVQGISRKHTHENVAIIAQRILNEIDIHATKDNIYTSINEAELMYEQNNEVGTFVLHIAIQPETVSWEKEATLYDENGQPRNSYSKHIHGIFTRLPPDITYIEENLKNNKNTNPIMHTITASLFTQKEVATMKNACHKMYIGGMIREEGYIAMSQRTITKLITEALNFSMYDIIGNDMYLGIPEVAFQFNDVTKLVPKIGLSRHEYCMKVIFTQEVQK